MLDLPLLRLRCAWCRKLFDYQLKPARRVLDEGLPRTCGAQCKAKVRSYEYNIENNLWRNATHERGMKPMRDFSNIQPWPNPKPLKIQRVKVAIAHTDEAGNTRGGDSSEGFIVNIAFDPGAISRPRA